MSLDFDYSSKMIFDTVSRLVNNDRDSTHLVVLPKNFPINRQQLIPNKGQLHGTNMIAQACSVVASWSTDELRDRVGNQMGIRGHNLTAAIPFRDYPKVTRIRGNERNTACKGFLDTIGPSLTL